MGLFDGSFPLSKPTYENWEDLTTEEKLIADSLMAVYAAMIDRLDQNIGKIIKKIKELGEYDNTVFMFMSDNGCQPQGPGDGSLNPTSRDYPIGSIGRWASLNQSWANVGNTPFRYYKNWSHEGGICTPFIVYWPAMKDQLKAGITDFPAHFIDIMPTLLEITSAKYPSEHKGESVFPYQGISLLPVWKGEQVEREDPIFWQWSRGKAIRMNHYKMVSGNDGPWELYDMMVDKTETNNLIGQHEEKVKELEKAYDKWFREVKKKK
jgi:arylsulfatase